MFSKSWHGRLRFPVTAILLGIIKVYKYTLSPLLGPACRFYPTCSSYAYEAIRRHGPLKGGRLALKRVIRCHPFNAGGFDPVP